MGGRAPLSSLNELDFCEQKLLLAYIFWKKTFIVQNSNGDPMAYSFNEILIFS